MRDDGSLQSGGDEALAGMCKGVAIGVIIGPYKNVQNLDTNTTDRGDSRQCFLELLIAWIQQSLVWCPDSRITRTLRYSKVGSSKFMMANYKVDHSTNRHYNKSPTMLLEVISCEPKSYNRKSYNGRLSKGHGTGPAGLLTILDIT